MWHRLNGPNSNIQKQFARIWGKNGWPLRAAIFVSRDLRTKSEDLYFTPLASELASDLLEKHAATACRPPDISRLVLLVGDHSMTGAFRD